jgi:hypothetical protein
MTDKEYEAEKGRDTRYYNLLEVPFLHVHLDRDIFFGNKIKAISILKP